MQLRGQWRGRRKETKQRTHYAHRANKEQALDVSLKLETVYKNDTFNKIYKQRRFYRSIYKTSSATSGFRTFASLLPQGKGSIIADAGNGIATFWRSPNYVQNAARMRLQRCHSRGGEKGITW